MPLLKHGSPVERSLRLIRYTFEGLLAYLCYGLFRVMPLDLASDIGGRMGRLVGPLLPFNERALANLRRAMPDLTPDEQKAVITEMWENLGRVVAEYPNLDRIWADREKRIEFHGDALIRELITDGKPGILFSGHLANWELAQVGSRLEGLELSLIYRSPNNPLIRPLLKWLRRPASRTHVPKSASGARQALSILKQGGHLGMLVDQKMNEGLLVPFFGIPAMTGSAIAAFGMHFQCPIVPARTERLGGCRFRVTVFEPLQIPRSGDRRADTAVLMLTINQLMESWVRERPGQWLWLHNRWPDTVPGTRKTSSREARHTRAGVGQAQRL